jgi:hypothetical protein
MNTLLRFYTALSFLAVVVSVVAAPVVASSATVTGFSQVQSSTPSNGSITGAAGGTATITIHAAAGKQVHIYSVNGFCAGSPNGGPLTITDGAVKIFNIGLNGTFQWNTALTGTLGTSVAITYGPCTFANGAPAPPTLNFQADQF